jgi:hypothetical protein
MKKKLLISLLIACGLPFQLNAGCLSGNCVNGTMTRNMAKGLLSILMAENMSDSGRLDRCMARARSIMRMAPF